MSNIIEVTGLKKSYGQVQAVKGIDFAVQEGSLFAFLGPNGAGKSTTIDILCTFLQPDAGTVRINGHLLGKDNDFIRSSIGIVFQGSVLDSLLTVKENLEVRGSFYGINRKEWKNSLEEAVDSTGIAEFLNRPYGKLSGGQRRRADIARALIHRPKILFLDEPTTGLDPQTRKKVWDMVRSLQKRHNMTVFLTTHYMEEAASADDVVVIDHGEIVAQGTPAQLKEQYAKDCICFTPKPEMQQQFQQWLDNSKLAYTLSGAAYSVVLERTMAALPLLKQCETLIDSFEVIQGTMDDAFLGIIGKEIRE